MRSLPAILIIALRRLLKEWGLTLLAITGVTFAIAFCTTVPLYTNTVYNNVLQTELYDKRRSMPAFGLLWRYKGDAEKDLSWEDVQPVSDYLAINSAEDLSLPQLLATRFVMSPIFDVYSPDQTSFEKRFALTEIRFGAQSDIEDHIGLVAALETPPASDVIQVMVSEQLLDFQDWTLGQSFMLLMEKEKPLGLKTYKIPVQISGVWRKKDPGHPYWFFNPTGLLDDLLLLQESTYARQLAPLIDDDIDQALWYQILDGNAFLPNHTEGFLRRLNTTTIRAGNLLPGVELMVAPAGPALRTYQEAAMWLTVAMFALSIPALVITVIFLGMVVNLMIQHQRAEIAVLRSRGASEEQTLGIAVLQALLIGTAALIAGIPLGRWMTLQLGRARGFLNFSGPADIRLIVTPANLQIGLAIVCGLMLAMAWTTYGLLNLTIIRHHQAMGRVQHKPWWQRAGIDIVLLMVTLYGVTQLRSQDLTPMMLDGTGEEFIKQDPLLYVIPALCSLSFVLISLRILPSLSEIAAKGLALSRQVTSLLAMRQISRQPARYSPPIIILALTLSLAVFTSTLAKTLRDYESTQAYRDIGADLSLYELGENTEIDIQLEVEKLCVEDPELPCPWENQSAADAWIEEMGLRDRPRWRFLPLNDHQQAGGVQAITPIGRYSVEPLSREFGSTGIYLGLDRSTFVSVAYWEPGFADENLGTLMNALAVVPNSMLVSNDLKEQWSLVIGDSVSVKIRIAEPGTVGAFQEVGLSLQVAGFVSQFPSWSPNQGPLIVGNLDYLFQEAGGQFPHHVWIKTDADADAAALTKAVRDLGYKIQTWDAPSVRVEYTLTSPEFKGLMGLLSIGFLISTFLAVLGLMLYLFTSFQRRSLEVGALRAIGFAKRQVSTLMIWELVILMLLGSVGGGLIGMAISVGLIPYMQLSARTMPLTSTMAVHFEWQHVVQIFGIFTILFVVMTAVLLAALSRIKLYAVLKMGDTV